ncbi:hypothetical protein ACFPIJ_36635 [Dactylosporangium cerinum]|uniref:Uncharacterized protein n=1 Tax=Dactylosporangium cerinum TaxID=1434730 RepID=A0ABV9W5R7_9ACTN
MPLLDSLLDPPRELFGWRQSSAVGFGIEDAVQWASPVAVVVAMWAKDVLLGAGQSVLEDRTKGWMTKLLKDRRKPATPAAPTRAELIERVREYAIELDMKPARAELLAQAVVESLLEARDAERASNG